MRYFLTIQYDGTNFEGYATQKHQNTVQDHLEAILSKIFKEQIKTHGASRTDSKVHAHMQLVIFDSEIAIPTDRLKVALNNQIREDVFVQSVEIVNDNFHPRFHSVEKTYVYKIAKQYDVFNRNYQFHIFKNPDVELMREASKYLIGEHDFSAFCGSKSTVVNKVRQIYEITITEDDKAIEIKIRGNGFLYRMIRIIVGTLLVISEKQLKPIKMQEILESKDRRQAFRTAKPHGLHLMEIVVDEEMKKI